MPADKVGNYAFSDSRLCLADGSCPHHLGRITLILNLVGLKVQHDFLIVRNSSLPTDMILGTDFMFRNKIRFQFDPLRLHVQGSKLEVHFASVRVRCNAQVKSVKLIDSVRPRASQRFDEYVSAASRDRRDEYEANASRIYPTDDQVYGAKAEHASGCGEYEDEARESSMLEM